MLYLAVAPQVWGAGVARALLTDIHHFAMERSVALELWVIADNVRAMTTYAKSGWVQTRDAKVRNASGRLEHRLVLPTMLPLDNNQRPNWEFRSEEGSVCGRHTSGVDASGFTPFLARRLPLRR